MIISFPFLILHQLDISQVTTFIFITVKPSLQLTRCWQRAFLVHFTTNFLSLLFISDKKRFLVASFTAANSLPHDVHS